MKKIVIGILFFCIIYFAATDIYAQCDCGGRSNITAQEEFKLAAAVFVGKVVEVKKTRSDSKTGDYIETVKFEVTKAWKQDLERFTEITNKIEYCLNGFDENEEWLVYVYKKKDGTLGTHCCCSRTKTIYKAREDLKAFEESGEKEAKVIDKSKSNN